MSRSKKKIAMLSIWMGLVASGAMASETPFVPPSKVEPDASWQKVVNVNSFVPSHTVLVLQDGGADLRITLPYGSAYAERTEERGKYPRGYIVTDGGNFFYEVSPRQVAPANGDKKYHYVEGIPYEKSSNKELKEALFARLEFRNSKLRADSSAGKYEQRGLTAAYWDYLPYRNDTVMLGSINFSLDKNADVEYHMGFDAPGKPIAMIMESLFKVVSPSVRPASVVDDMAIPKKWNDINFYLPKGFVQEKTDNLNQLLYVSDIGEVFSVYKADIKALKRKVAEKDLLGTLVLGEVGALQEEKARLSLIGTVWHRASSVGYVESEKTQDGTVLRTMTSLYPAGDALYRIDYRYSINSGPQSEQLMRDIVQTIGVDGAQQQKDGYGVLGNLFTEKPAN